MSRLLRWSALLLAVGVLAGLAGCTRPLRERVQGKWKHVPSGTVITFLKDGSFTCGLGFLQGSGSYTTPDEQHVRITISGAPGLIIGSHVYEVKLEGDNLVLILGTEPLEFTRTE